MKLLTKLTIRYVLFSLAAMAVSGFAIYFVLGNVINYQLDERLNENLLQVKTQMQKNPQAVFYDPYISITPVENNSSVVTLSDSLVYNETEDENEECRKISAVISAGDKFYKVEIVKSKIESEDLQLTLALITILVMILLTGTLIYINRQVAKSIWKPFYENLKIIEKFSVAALQPVQLNKTGISEFDQLNEVVNGLTRQIITDFQNQKQLSEDISHELQTPLSIISSRLESLLEKPELKDHADALNSIYASVRRLSKLNKALILLGKIENNQFASDEKSNLKSIVTEKLDEFSELIGLKKLTLETEINDDFIVSIPTMLAEMLVNNLLSNSINHNFSGGKISIKMNAEMLSLCNTGSEKIAEPEKLFNRFYKADPSSQSVGLGLAIAKKICDLHGLKIKYMFTNGMHNFVIIRQDQE